MEDEIVHKSDVFTFSGLYLYIWAFVLAVVALVMWGLNIWLGSKAPDSVEALTPYLLPVAGALITLGFVLYFKLRGKLIIRKKNNGTFSAEVNLPGKEQVYVDPVSDILFFYTLKSADHGTNSIERYAQFLDQHKIPVLKIYMSGRTFGESLTKGYQPLNNASVLGGKFFMGNPEAIRKFWVKRILS